MTFSPEHSPKFDRMVYLLFGGALLLALWILTRGWDASILDRHDFRQMQTALSIHWIKESGYQLDYPTPLFGPPWSVPMEFPIYQSVVAALSNTFNTGLEATGRAVSVMFLFATLPAAYLLAGVFGMERRHRLLILAAILLSPVYLFYARTVMIETTALCFSTWFLYAIARAVRDNCVRCAVGATVFATLAALAKVTTFLVLCPAGAVIFLWFWIPRWQQRRTSREGLLRVPILAATPVLVAGMASLWWVGRSDRVKNSNPFSGFLTSRELSGWNWGTWEQRISPFFRSELWNSLTGYVMSEASLTVLLIGLACVTAARRRAAACLFALYVGAMLIFPNLYLRHDYYYCANAILLLGGAGVILAGIWENARLPAALRVLMIGLFFGGQLLGYHRTFGDYTRRELPQAPAIAEVIRETVPEDGVVLIYGWDWNAKIPYFSERRALMVPNGREDDVTALDAILSELAPYHVAAMVVNNPVLQRSSEFIRERTERFGLSASSFASSEEGDLYLSEEIMLPAARSLEGRNFEGLSFNVGTETQEGPELQDSPVDKLALPFLQPHPVRARSMYGFDPGEIEGRATLNAHPWSELQFEPPLDARTILAEVGLNPLAYSPNEASVTDGVTVEIIEVRPNGVRRVLLRRTLDPVAREEDRGFQRLQLDAGPFEGILRFRITPGPAGRFNNDWAYWSRIEIQ